MERIESILGIYAATKILKHRVQHFCGGAFKAIFELDISDLTLLCKAVTPVRVLLEAIDNFLSIQLDQSLVNVLRTAWSDFCLIRKIQKQYVIYVQEKYLILLVVVKLYFPGSLTFTLHNDRERLYVGDVAPSHLHFLLVQL